MLWGEIGRGEGGEQGVLGEKEDHSIIMYVRIETNTIFNFKKDINKYKTFHKVKNSKYSK